MFIPHNVEKRCKREEGKGLDDQNKPLRSFPNMLKELLKKEELLTVLSKEVIAFFQTLVGPPSGINIRNLLW